MQFMVGPLRDNWISKEVKTHVKLFLDTIRDEIWFKKVEKTKKNIEGKQMKVIEFEFSNKLN